MLILRTINTPASKMPKALTFKGDKKPFKKRKRAPNETEDDTSKQLVLAGDAAPDDDDNWVSAEALSDISGPIMLVLPTNPLTCLATDAMGKVHASPVENMVEDAPQTAEPHLVSQVWIATRVVGSEGDFTFKGHHGRYLGCDQYGICSAAREAISPEETFRCSEAETETGAFDVRTMRATFLAVDGEKSPPEVRGDVEEVGEAAHIRVRMQARFKQKVRAKISRKELEDEVGRRLEDDEVKKLKKARREGNYHEAMLDVKVKNKHDKFA